MTIHGASKRPNVVCRHRSGIGSAVPLRSGSRYRRDMRSRPGLRSRIAGAVRFVVYRGKAPRTGEGMWLTMPEHVSALIEGIPRRQSGSVKRGNWDLRTQDAQSLPKIKACLDHWLHGTPWERTGIYDYMLALLPEHGGEVDGCRTFADVVARYQRLDAIFVQIAREERLRVQSELFPGAFRELGGILFHIGRDGAPIFGLGGHHRLAMAIALNLSVIPVQVGVVHRDALGSWRHAFHDRP